MSETRMPRAPMSSQEIREAWEFTASPFATHRRRTREVMVGNVGIGGSNPLRLQSMTISDTLDTESLLSEIEALWRAGSELVRVTAPNRTCAENLGVIINMKEPNSTSDEEYHRWLEGNPENRCFSQAVPRMSALQDAANFQTSTRSYLAKYPGQAGASVRALAKELLERLEAANNAQAEDDSAPEAATA